MDAAVADAGTERGKRADTGDFLYHSSSGITHIQVGDKICVPKDWEDTGKIRPSCGMGTDMVDATVEPGWDMEVPPPGRDYGRCGHAGGGYIRHPSSEHHHI